MLDDKKKYFVAAAIIILILVFGAGVKFGLYKAENDSCEWEVDIEELTAQANVTDTTEDPLIHIYVCGAVQGRGVYTLPQGARVYEAIDLAMPMENAVLDHLGMARIMEDGETIIVYTREEIDNSREITGLLLPAYQSGDGRVNINTATEADLADKLPGIGPVLAQKIVDYRDKQGRFQRVEDIKNVSGIGEKRYEDIKDKIKVR